MNFRRNKKKSSFAFRTLESIFTDHLDDVSSFFNLDRPLRTKAVVAFSLFYLVIASFGITAAATFSSGSLFLIISVFILTIVLITVVNISVLIIYPDDILLQKRVTVSVLAISFVIGLYFGYSMLTNKYDNTLFSEHSFYIYFSIWVLSFLCFQFAIKLFNKVTGAVVEQRDLHELELNLARKHQKQMLPDIFAKKSAFDLHAQTLLASEVGGDYFDMVEYDGKIYCAIGDVSGHGMAAGLLMASLKSSFLTEIKYNRDLSKVIREINRHICLHSDKKMFITFSIVEIDLDTLNCRIVNAGHLPILLKKNGGVTEIKPKGLALGVTVNAIYELEELSLTAGDKLLLITDGFTESRSPDNEEWGFNGIKEWWLERPEQESPKETTDGLLYERKRFSLTDIPTDDCSVICLVFHNNSNSVF